MTVLYATDFSVSRLKSGFFGMTSKDCLLNLIKLKSKLTTKLSCEKTLAVPPSPEPRSSTERFCTFICCSIIDRTNFPRSMERLRAVSHLLKFGCEGSSQAGVASFTSTQLYL